MISVLCCGFNGMSNDIILILLFLFLVLIVFIYFAELVASLSAPWG